MALVACPECGKQVSTEAPACPHCGKQLSATAAPGVAWGPGPTVFSPTGTVGPEQPLWEGRPSMALLYGKILRLIIRFLVLFAIGYLVITIALPSLASVSSELRALIEQNSSLIQLAVVVVLTLAFLPSVLSLAPAIAHIKNTHYKVTNQRIIIESGVLSKSLEEIDMRSVDDTVFHQSFLERIFGIGEVVIVSTDKVAPRFALHGIPDPRNTRELIRATAYQASQRQLFTRST